MYRHLVAGLAPGEKWVKVQRCWRKFHFPGRTLLITHFVRVGSEELRLEDRTWIWYGENVMGVKYHRCKAVFETENLIIAHHEYSDDNRMWSKWMDIKLSKTE